MARVTDRGEILRDRTAYILVRRSQASIAGYRHFRGGDLAKYLEQDSLLRMAKRLADHYFHKSAHLAIYDQVQELYLAHLILAPIIQRIPFSARYDWHRGHLLGWFRVNAGGRIRRNYFGIRTVERSFQPDLLTTKLKEIGIYDGGFLEYLLDLYRRHAGGTTLKDMLAHQIFDPILLHGGRKGYELRFANQLFRLEKEPFDEAVDLRKGPATVLDYFIQSVEHRGGWHLEIRLSEATLKRFRESVKRILASPASPQHKCLLVDNCSLDFVERARWARTAKPQVDDLRRWLADKLRSLAGTVPEAKHIAPRLTTLWLQRVDSRLHLKKPNFFLDPRAIDEKTYRVFFSPYREDAR